MNRGAGPKAYWAAMSAEDRSAEMKRRFLVRSANANGKPKAGKPKRGRRPKQTWTCKICGKTGFRNPQSVAVHTRNTHPKGERDAQPSEKDYSNHVAYLYGKIETIVEYYSAGNALPISSLTEGLAELLRHQESRKVLGA